MEREREREKDRARQRKSASPGRQIESAREPLPLRLWPSPRDTFQCKVFPEANSWTRWPLFFRDGWRRQRSLATALPSIQNSWLCCVGPFEPGTFFPRNVCSRLRSSPAQPCLSGCNCSKISSRILLSQRSFLSLPMSALLPVLLLLLLLLSRQRRWRRWWREQGLWSKNFPTKCESKRNS